MFINANDPMMPGQFINDVQPFIKLPFPPMINPRDLITLNPDGREPSRAPNAFIIYRKLFIKTAKCEGYSLPMTVMSPMVSKSWKKEPEMVKKEYKRIAREAFLYRSEICPRPKRERKRKRWNIISFDKPDRKPSSHINSQKSVSKASPLLTPISFPLTPKDKTNSLILNLGLFADWEDLLCPSPIYQCLQVLDNPNPTEEQQQFIGDFAYLLRTL
ncbi:10218_t:CDS:2 [Acaulospora morrowiae]|uniref:10218_t:CDS:1 n=1 Tax=Acaulospora morrowiae TaxID=94023 RepID=A0A9N9A2F1_9GLOM|nr:10218_t:CDS:2 [Acaulospora morrowiae]